MTVLSYLLCCSVVIGSAGAITGQETPHDSDAHTSLLLHLDGDARDASGAENDGRVQGPVAWAEGRFGKSLSLDGRAGVVIEGSGATYVGRRSWTVECWFRPLREQPLNAVLVASGWGYERIWYLQISEGRRLVACFSGGHFSGPSAAKTSRRRSSTAAGITPQRCWTAIAAAKCGCTWTESELRRKLRLAAPRSCSTKSRWGL